MQESSQFHLTLLYFMVSAQESLHSAFFAKAVTMTDLALPERNPSLAVNQFFSALLSDNHLVMRLLCRNRGWNTASELLRCDPEAWKAAGQMAHKLDFVCVAVFVLVSACCLPRP
jgi:hypothetical protein